MSHTSLVERFSCLANWETTYALRRFGLGRTSLVDSSVHSRFGSSIELFCEQIRGVGKGDQNLESIDALIEKFTDSEVRSELTYLTIAEILVQRRDYPEVGYGGAVFSS